MVIQTVRYALLLTIVLILVLAFKSRGDGATLGKPVFWAALTPFEAGVVANAEKARRGDPDALLALALVASGEVRTQKAHDRIARRVHDFIQKVRPKIDRQATMHDKGEKLLKAMHANYFKGGKDAGGAELIRGYDADQSEVSTIFDTGRFNCISSAILYIVLARFFDLQVLGVVTSEHAFVQITDEDGGAIEVETTSRDGYNLVHDKAFFKKHFSRFSKSRNLRVPTYEAYLKRRVEQPHIFISENMNHQHTSAKRMKPATRQRLHEIMGYLDGDGVSSQLARINTLYNACIGLSSRPDREGVAKMRRVMALVVDHIRSRAWINQTGNEDIASIWTSTAAINIMLGRFLQNEKAFDAALGYYDEAARWSRTPNLKRQAQIHLYGLEAYRAFNKNQFKTAIKSYRRLIDAAGEAEPRQVLQAREGIAAAYWNLGNAAQSKERWKTAAGHYAAIEKWTGDAAILKQSRVASARSRAMGHYERRQWARAISFFKEGLGMEEPGTVEIVRKNIGAAYTQWGNDLFTERVFEAALNKYEAALKMLEPGDHEALYANIAAAYHNLAVPLLNQRRKADAVALLKKGVRRFPGCRRCRVVRDKLSR